MLAINPGRNTDRAHRRLPDRRSGRFSPEATGTNLIYSFPHHRGEFRVYPKLFPTAAGNQLWRGHPSFLGRFIVTSSATSAIELGYFFGSSKIFSVEISRSGWVLRNAASQRLESDTTMGYLHTETSQIRVVIDRLNQQKYVM
jgi:hypothetical protein